MRRPVGRFGGASTLALVLVVLLVGAALGAALGSRGSSPGERSRSLPRVAMETASRHAARAPAGAASRAARGSRGPRGPRGKRGRRGPAGPPGSSDEQVLQLGVDWDGFGSGQPQSDSVTLPGIGQLTISCPEAPPATPDARQLTLSYGAGPGFRTVATLTKLQGSSAYPDNADNERLETTGAPIVYEIPNNGMTVGTFSAETVNGDGSPPGSLPTAQITLSSSWKTNDSANPAANYCHISGQVIAEGAGG